MTYEIFVLRYFFYFVVYNEKAIVSYSQGFLFFARLFIINLIIFLIVPAYEVFIPYVKKSIVYDNARIKRNTDFYRKPSHQKQTRTIKLGVTAFNKLYHLNMTENKQLFTSNFKVEVKTRNGTVVKRDVGGGNCYFHGDVHGDDRSLAAMSTCYGQLVRNIPYRSFRKYNTFWLVKIPRDLNNKCLWE